MRAQQSFFGGMLAVLLVSPTSAASPVTHELEHGVATSAPKSSSTFVASSYRSAGTNTSEVPLVDNQYAALCAVSVTPTGGDVFVQGHAVLFNSDFDTAGTTKVNIVVRAGIRLLQANGSHLAVAELGGPAVDELDLVTGQWLTIKPSLYYRPPEGVPITFEVAVVTSYHPYYNSGTLIGNHWDNPCYISATQLP